MRRYMRRRRAVLNPPAPAMSAVIPISHPHAGGGGSTCGCRWRRVCSRLRVWHAHALELSQHPAWHIKPSGRIAHGTIACLDSLTVRGVHQRSAGGEGVEGLIDRFGTAPVLIEHTECYSSRYAEPWRAGRVIRMRPPTSRIAIVIRLIRPRPWMAAGDSMPGPSTLILPHATLAATVSGDPSGPPSPSSPASANSSLGLMNFVHHSPTSGSGR
jgi:hypothetical protein